MPRHFYESDTENAPECECLHRVVRNCGIRVYLIDAEPCKQNPDPTLKGIRHSENKNVT